jgi:hypothetical protein
MSDADKAREELLKTLWEGINSYMAERWIDFEIRRCETSPNEPFADTGAALERLLAVGASRRDLCLLCRHAAYDSTFQTLIEADLSGLTSEELGGIHESLLGSDPSGMEGRPGSAPPPKPGPYPWGQP